MKLISIVCICFAFATVSASQEDCSERCMDLMFVLDGSSSVSESDWNMVKSWIKSFVENLDLKKSVAVGVVEYSQWTRGATYQPYLQTEIELGEYDNVKSFNTAIDKIPLYGRSTRYTFQAIWKTIKEDFMGSSCFSDDSVKKILILITNGVATDQVDFLYSVGFARRHQIKIYVIGVGYNVDMRELKATASKVEYTNHVYRYGSYDGLPGSKGLLEIDLNEELAGKCSV